MSRLEGTNMHTQRQRQMSARQLLGRWGACAGVLLLLACKTKREQLDKTTFLCDPKRSDQCGTIDGRPLACHSSEQLGGQALCTESCSTDVGGSDAGIGNADVGDVCLDSTAKVRSCRPSLGPTGGG